MFPKKSQFIWTMLNDKLPFLDTRHLEDLPLDVLLLVVDHLDTKCGVR